MSKPPLRHIPSDDCAVVVDGETYYPHEGESLSLIGGARPIRLFQVVNRLRQASVQVEALQDEPDGAVQIAELLDPQFEELCELLASRIVDWTWTDARGQPLPPPNARAVALLENQEVLYLITVVQGEGPAERKNGSSSSPTTSSATTSPPTEATPSTTGRSRTKA